MNRCLLAFATSSLAFASACGDELGPCDESAARQLVYGTNGRAVTKGQALLHESCGSAAQCHAATATGEARRGAPFGMNFDMLPRPIGWASVLTHRDAIWASVREETMPPDGFVVSEETWSFDLVRTATSARLPPLATEDGKAALRNWLACGAPVVSDTGIPSWTQPEAPRDGGAEDDFAAIYADVLAPRCASGGCHDDGAAGGLALNEPCAALSALFAQGVCEAEPRVVPGNESSALLDKLGPMPRCGSPMPPSGPLGAGELDRVRAWVLDGAPAGACSGAP